MIRAAAFPRMAPDLLLLQRRLYDDLRRPSASSPRDLMPALLDRRNLDAAWDRVRSAEGARTPGVDGEVADEIVLRSGRWIAALADDLYRGRYQPSAIRWIEIPRGEGGAPRRLGILTVRDRVVHAACKQVLEPVLEPRFAPHSFGFRPGRSVPAALQHALRLLSGGGTLGPRLEFALRADIADCFPSIDHELLFARLAEAVQDSAFLALLRTLLAPGATVRRRWWAARAISLVQGSPLSPLLCNAYLHPLDAALKDVSESSGHGLHLLRYADDLLLLASSRATLAQGEREMQRSLRALRLELNARKRRVASVEEGIDWLGVRIQRRRHGWLDRPEFGYVVPDAKVIDMFRRLDEITEPPPVRIDPAAFDLGRWITSVNDQLRDWHQAYRFADNAQAVVEAVDLYADQRVGALLESVTRKRRAAVRRAYRVKLPRGFSTWEVNGHRMTVLSALAPRRPDARIRPPEWMRAAANGGGRGESQADNS